MTTPTDTELNEYLAIKMRWHKSQAGKGYPWFWCEPDYMEDSLYRHSGKSVMMDCDWNPCEDLNQMFIVEERVIELGLWNKYARDLAYSMRTVENTFYPTVRHHATARQKAEAAYRTMEGKE